MLVLAPVTNASVEDVVCLALLIEIALKADQELPRLAQNGLVLLFVGCQQRHHRNRGVVGNQVGLVNAAVSLGATEDESVTFCDPSRLPVLKAAAWFPIQRHQRQPRNRWLLRCGPMTIRILSGLQPTQPAINRPLDFVSKRNVGSDDGGERGARPDLIPRE